MGILLQPGELGDTNGLQPLSAPAERRSRAEPLVVVRAVGCEAASHQVDRLRFYTWEKVRAPQPVDQAAGSPSPTVQLVIARNTWTVVNHNQGLRLQCRSGIMPAPLSSEEVSSASEPNISTRSASKSIGGLGFRSLARNARQADLKPSIALRGSWPSRARSAKAGKLSATSLHASTGSISGSGLDSSTWVEI